ncbi:MAG: histidinol-phosphate transaminase [Clostridia bacterium]|nr:histidinol-phosphate transaminase [Clostridia bacterium]
MSRYMCKNIVPYVPGEQPKQKLIKLNTNESPFPPSPAAIVQAQRAAGELQLYSDPECKALKTAAAEYFGVTEDELLFTNGSDDILNFAFAAFCGEAAFADITYGFYSVLAGLHGVPCDILPLKEDFTIDPDVYIGIGKTIFIANPNAPTGLALPLSDIERIVAGNPDNVVVIDEAYVDFGGESAVGLVKKYDNLLVVQTFSKSRSLAGGRLGFAVGHRELIKDLNTIKYSTNPYNVNRMTMAAGIGALQDVEYFEKNCKAICATRSWVTKELEQMGFAVLPSLTNFIFARSEDIDGKTFNLKLREKGILVRHFDTDRLRDYNRITVGSDAQMRSFIESTKSILEEIK